MDLDASRVRRPSRRFGWVDRRILHDGHLAALDGVAAALYLILCAVADRHGLSWYPVRMLATWTKRSPAQIEQALLQLARRELIAMAGPLVQVLDLDLVLPRPKVTPAPVPVAQPGRPESRQHPQMSRSAQATLAELPAAAREAAIEQARQKLTQITNGREPSPRVVEAVAWCLIRDRTARR